VHGLLIGHEDGSLTSDKPGPRMESNALGGHSNVRRLVSRPLFVAPSVVSFRDPWATLELLPGVGRSPHVKASTSKYTLSTHTYLFRL